MQSFGSITKWKLCRKNERRTHLNREPTHFESAELDTLINHNLSVERDPVRPISLSQYVSISWRLFMTDTHCISENASTYPIRSPNIRLHLHNRLIPKNQQRWIPCILKYRLSPTYRTSTVDCRISSIVHRLFESRPAAGACGKKAANEKAEEAHVIWKGMSCLIQNTLDAGRYN